MWTAFACARIVLCAAMNGSLSEFPWLQFPYGKEQRDGGKVPFRWVRIICWFGSFNVVQCLTRSPKCLKHISAKYPKSFLQNGTCNLRTLIFNNKIWFVRDFIKPLTASPGLTNFETGSQVLEGSPNGSVSQMA